MNDEVLLTFLTFQYKNDESYLNVLIVSSTLYKAGPKLAIYEKKFNPEL